MNNNNITLLIIGILVLVIIQLLKNIVEKIKTLINTIPPQIKETLHKLQVEPRLKKYNEEIDIEDIKDIAIKKLLPAITSLFYFIIALIIIIFIISFIASYMLSSSQKAG